MTAHAEVRPMPPEGVELVRRSFEAFNGRDLNELVKLYHQDCIWDMSKFAGWPECAVYRGHEGLRTILAEWEAAWEDVHFEPGRWHLYSSVGLGLIAECVGRRAGSGKDRAMEAYWNVALDQGPRLGEKFRGRFPGRS